MADRSNEVKWIVLMTKISKAIQNELFKNLSFLFTLRENGYRKTKT